MRKTTRSIAAVTLSLFAGLLAIGSAQPAAPPPRLAPEVLNDLKYRYIGPVGNRLTSAAGVPGQPNIYYVGAASGGVWKTTDAGAHWDPLFDGQSAQSIGALAVAPSDPNVVWAGTGEACIRSHISVGDGIYKSTDAGRTWTRMGLDRTGRIARVVVDPRNPDVVMACALGHAYGPQPDRGVFRTADGGKTWDKVLFVDENTGCSDMAMDPANPRILFAGMWQLEIHTWGRDSGGPGSGLFKSSDGGLTWKRLTGRGLPTKPVGKVAVAIARSNPSRVYAMIETGDGVPWNGQETERGTLWRSDDAGESWRVVSFDRSVNGRAHYYSHMAVAPDNENEMYFMTASFAVSTDGGETLTLQEGRRSPGGDNHHMWIDPTNADRMIVANDSGTSISVNRGRTWERVQLPIAQMYHVTVDNEIPYNVVGNKQDGPSYRGPSNSATNDGPGGAAIPRSAWHTVGGGESGWSTPDSQDSNVIWSSASGSGSVGGIVVRFDDRSRQGRNVEVWPDQTNGSTAADVKYRFNWTMPLTISPHDHNKIYVGSQHVHQTTDGGQSWQVISPDLTTNDKARQQFSGGLTGDNIGVEYAPVVMAIAESRIERGLIWAGTNDGQIQVTRDAGKSWTNVTAAIPNLPKWGTVSNIEPSRFNPGIAYVAVDLHQVNNRDPFVYRTSDYGKTWKAIAEGIPVGVFSYAHCIREDPVRRGLLYLGTENGLYVSFDDGDNWAAFQSNLPHAPVYWLTVQEQFNDLVVATYGRGFWIMDDLGPLQQATPRVLDSTAHLFTPRAAYRYRSVTANANQSDDPTAGQNPPYGAVINYYLETVPSGEVTVTIQDSKGLTVQTLRPPKRAGMNRLWWDLRYEPSREVRLRTSPLYAPDVRMGPDGWRPLPEGGRLTLLAAPGAYTVKLTAGGQDYTQTLTVRKDPHSIGSDTDLQMQTTMLLDLRKDLETVADMINVIEVVRSQIGSVTSLVVGSSNAAAITTAAAALEKKLVEVEDNLMQRKLTGRGQDGVRWPSKLISRLTYLANGLAGNDAAPTNQQKEVHGILKQQMAAQQGQLTDLLNKDVATFNSLLRELKIQNIITTAPTARTSN